MMDVLPELGSPYTRILASFTERFLFCCLLEEPLGAGAGAAA